MYKVVYQLFTDELKKSTVINYLFSLYSQPKQMVTLRTLFP